MVIYTAKVGTNSDIFPNILELYFKKGATIADVTHGKGTFWKKVTKSDYNLLATDISNGIDLGNTSYNDNSLDGFVLDPPYAHSSHTPLKPSISKQYNLNMTSSHHLKMGVSV